MKHKIIFLDMDGVCNNPKVYTSEHFAKWPDGQIDKENVKHVDRLVQESGAKIVVSSSWRVPLKLMGMKDLFHRLGLNWIVLGVTPELHPKRFSELIPRGREIQQWMDDSHYEIESFVILDDDADMAHLNHRLVRTRGHVGMTERDYELALKLLNTPL